jgi:raffinose/stachyose/melibiose transport system permease protein
VTVTVIILKGVGAWNDYLYPYYILQKSSLYTLVLLIKQYFGSADASSNLHGAAAVATICVLPVIVLYLFLQKFFIRGQVDSAVK